jgi:hypothetical protein
MKVSRRIGWLVAAVVLITLFFAGSNASAYGPRDRAAKHKKPHKSKLLNDPAYLPVTACETISTSGYYILQNNLTQSTNGHCIIIAASDVTLNLAGWNITGPGYTSSAGAGIFIELSYKNTYIVGNTNFSAGPGTISGFGDGVKDDGTDSFIEDMIFTSNYYGILAEGTGSVAMDFDANSNVQGIDVNQGSNVFVSDFQAESNETYGVYMFKANNVTCTLFNASSTSLYNGVDIYDSSNIFITAFVSDSNGTTGVFLEGGTDEAVVQGGEASKNEYSGIDVDSGVINVKVGANVAQNNDQIEEGFYDLYDANGNSPCVNQWFGNTYDPNSAYGPCTHQP